MLDRIHGRAGGRETPVGIVPNEVDLDLKGLDLAPQAVREALAVRPEEWSAELESAAEFFEKIGPTMPKELTERRKKTLATMNSRPSEARIAAGR
jgi:phosphoenolpyruvate carboxykinase (GTP)